MKKSIKRIGVAVLLAASVCAATSSTVLAAKPLAPSLSAVMPDHLAITVTNDTNYSGSDTLNTGPLNTFQLSESPVRADQVSLRKLGYRESGNVMYRLPPLAVGEFYNFSLPIQLPITHAKCALNVKIGQQVNVAGIEATIVEMHADATQSLGSSCSALQVRTPVEIVNNNTYNVVVMYKAQ